MAATYLYLNSLRLKIARAKAQMTQTDLQKATGVNSKYLSANPVKVNVTAAGRIAQVLNVDLEYLLDDNQQDRNAV